jgi:hypothetical protein
MAFSPDEVSVLLAQSHRRCCVCHRFCGVKIETDHIVPIEDDGSDCIENAIPVCFECHAEIHSYNDKHPRGRKFLPEELQLHKKQWLEICADQPDLLIGAIRDADVGPLQALVDELDFNAVVANVKDYKNQAASSTTRNSCAPSMRGQFPFFRTTSDGLLLDAYRAMGAANAALESRSFKPADWSEATNEAQRLTDEARGRITVARGQLLRFLSNKDSS